MSCLASLDIYHGVGLRTGDQDVHVIRQRLCEPLPGIYGEHCDVKSYTYTWRWESFHVGWGACLCVQTVRTSGLLGVGLLVATMPGVGLLVATINLITTLGWGKGWQPPGACIRPGRPCKHDLSRSVVHRGSCHLQAAQRRSAVSVACGETLREPD